MVPTWQLALSARVPRRKLVDEAVDELREAAAAPGKPRVVLIEGPGGEGKSTAFHQVVASLLDADPNWRVLWRDNEIHGLPVDFLQQLVNDGRPLLIASDEADNIAAGLLAFVRAARERDHGLHLLLAARDTDWRAAVRDEAPWRQLIDFRRRRMRGVALEDAAKLIDAWSTLGKEGLGKLAGMTRENAIRRLIETAHDEVVKGIDGSLLGAMIELRYGEAFKEYVRKLLDRLRCRPAPGGSLLDAYAYIAAMHAENLLFFGKSVLATTLGCDERTLQHEVIRPLAEEAAAASHGNYVLTRHRAIADTAMVILQEEDTTLDLNQLFATLANAAERRFLDQRDVANIADWCFTLPRHFSEKNWHETAIRIAEALRDTDPSNVYLLVSLGEKLRKADRAAQAVEVFERAAEAGEIKSNRVFYYEWGTAAGNTGNHDANLWLAAVSLTDLDSFAAPTNEDGKLALAGLGVAAGALFEATGDRLFIEARGAAGQLGLRLRLDARTRGYLERYRAEAAKAGVGEMAVDRAFAAIERAVRVAYRRCAARDRLVDDLDVPMPEEISFTGLRRLFVSPPRGSTRRT